MRVVVARRRHKCVAVWTLPNLFYICSFLSVVQPQRTDAVWCVLQLQLSSKLNVCQDGAADWDWSEIGVSVGPLQTVVPSGAQDMGMGMGSCFVWI